MVAYASSVELRAGGARLTGFAYQGVARVRSAAGGTVRMMKFTSDTFSAFGGVTGTIARNGDSTVLTSPSLALSGRIVLYATKLSGKLMGVSVTLTPDNAESVVLRVLRSATPVVPVTMTAVVAQQPILFADAMRGRLTVAAS